MKDRNKSLTKAVGAAIYRRRKMLGLTQEMLAEKVGIGQQSLSRMEQGKMAPRFERLAPLAEALQCSVAELFFEQGKDVHVQARELAQVLDPLSGVQRAFLVDQMARFASFLSRQGTEKSCQSGECVPQSMNDLESR